MKRAKSFYGKIGKIMSEARRAGGRPEGSTPWQMRLGDVSGGPANIPSKFQAWSPLWGGSVARLPNFLGASSEVGQPKVGQKSWAGGAGERSTVCARAAARGEKSETRVLQ